MTLKYSIVLPIHNQADHIEEMVEQNASALAALNCEYEQLLVVNGSKDKSLETATAMSEKNSSVRVLESAPGWGNAVMAGLAAASGEFLCYTNSARTKPYNLVLLLKYGEINNQAVVKASRKARGSVARRIGSALFNLEARMLFSFAVWDVNGTPKVFHRDLLSTLNLTERGDLIDLQLIARCRNAGITIVEVPVFDTSRLAGESTTNIRSAITMYVGAWRLRGQFERRTKSRHE